MNTEYYVYVTIGYTGKFVECSKEEFKTVLEMARRKFDVLETFDECQTFVTDRYYAFVDYGVKDGVVNELFAMKKTLK